MPTIGDQDGQVLRARRRRGPRLRRGATLVEYSLMLAMIAMALALAAHAIGHVLKGAYATANAAVVTANTADDTPPDASID